MSRDYQPLFFFVLRQTDNPSVLLKKRPGNNFANFRFRDAIRLQSIQWRQSWSLLPPSVRLQQMREWKKKHVDHFCCQVLFTLDVTRSITFYQHMVFIFMNRYRTGYRYLAGFRDSNPCWGRTQLVMLPWAGFRSRPLLGRLRLQLFFPTSGSGGYIFSKFVRIVY